MKEMTDIKPTNLIIYIAGAYRSDTEDGVFGNIIAAREAAKSVWNAGGIPICPHLNTMFMGGVVSATRFIEADLEIVNRCDAVLMVQFWKTSEGAKIEKRFAEEHGIPVFEDLHDLMVYLHLDNNLPVIVVRPVPESIENNNIAKHKNELNYPFCRNCGCKIIFDSQDAGDMEGADIECECGEVTSL